MRRSIRQQVLVPILAIQAVTIAAITIVSVALAARRTERQIVDRLNGVVDVLDRSNFPLTGGDPGQDEGPLRGRVRRLSTPGDCRSPPATRRWSTAVWRRDSSPFPAPGGSCRLSDSPTLTVRTGPLRRSPRRLGHRPRGDLMVLYPESSWREARWDSAQAPLILGAGGAGVMAAATTWIAHRISGRIHRLQHQVARIAEGDFRELSLGLVPAP